jgi:hypothetical protein
METPFRLVDRFTRPGFLIAFDRELRVLDLLAPGEPQVLHEFSSTQAYNSEVAYSADCRFAYMCFERTIWQLDVKTGSVSVLAEPSRLPSWPADSVINWTTKMSDKDGFLYFGTLPDWRIKDLPPERQQNHLCRIDFKTLGLQCIDYPWPAGLDIDFGSGRIYGSFYDHDGQHILRIRDFDGGRREIPFERCYSSTHLRSLNGALHHSLRAGLERRMVWEGCNSFRPRR